MNRKHENKLRGDFNELLPAPQLLRDGMRRQQAKQGLVGTVGRRELITPKRVLAGALGGIAAMLALSLGLGLAADTQAPETETMDLRRSVSLEMDALFSEAVNEETGYPWVVSESVAFVDGLDLTSVHRDVAAILAAAP